MAPRPRFYSRPHEFEPLLPEAGRGALAERAADVLRRSVRLTGAAHPAVAATLRELLREMNSYYSNRIEGQSTHPLDIARALRADYSRVAATARLQRLAVAHIEAERALEGPPTEDVLTVEFLRHAHAEIYRRLPPDDRRSEGADIHPGELRTVRVVVGQHVPPEAAALPEFARRFDAVYGKRYPFDDSLVVIAAAHHRASWMHPFEDGNGRAVRLQTHCALFPFTNGLWSVSRGLARRREEYYQYLTAADAPRAGDLDGRGHLSDAGLGGWCRWFVDVCGDQVDFMTRLLSLDGVRDRIVALVASRAALDRRYRIETSLPLFHLFAAGPTSRGDFLRMTGLAERTARAALSHLLAAGLVRSRDHRAPVEIAFPLDALQLLFPDLYPEAATSPRG